MKYRRILGPICLVFLLSAVALGAVDCPQDTHAAIVKLREFAGRDRFRWQSRIQLDGKILSTDPLTRERAFSFLTTAFTPGNTLVRQFIQETGIQADLQSSAFWDLYARSYDLLACSRGYTGLMFKIADALQGVQTPSTQVLDLGAGTGNPAALLLYNHPELSALLIDSSAESRLIAEAKLRHLQIAPSRYEIRNGNITNLALYPANTFRAVILNNVLYTLPRDEQERIIRAAAAALQVGGVLIIGDPLPAEMTAMPRLFEFYRRNLESALDTGAPLEDFNLLAILVVNLIIQTSQQPRYFTEPGVHAGIAISAGLEQITRETAYFDGGSFQVFRRLP